MKKVLMVMPKSSLDSGQIRASMQLKQSSEDLGYQVEVLYFPALERNQSIWLAYPKYFWALAVSWCLFAKNYFQKGKVVSWAVGQTPFSWLRDGILMYLLLSLRKSYFVIASLQGSNFTGWKSDSKKAKIFTALLRKCHRVTVLGEDHKQKLVDFGVNAEQIVVTPNTADVTPLSLDKVKAKQASVDKVRLLHLSSLIDTKGYPDYLESLRYLKSEQNVEAVLCGRITGSQFANRFKKEDEAEQWLGKTLGDLKQLPNLEVSWVKGAWGADKDKLFGEAHIFVFPSVYAVEAQPLVLLEAMASGCAIITTTVGEIRTILSEREALFLPDCEPKNIAQRIDELINDPELRTQLGLRGYERFVNEFSMQKFKERWHDLLKSAEAYHVSLKA